MAQCRSCGYELPLDSRFCPQCATPVIEKHELGCVGLWLIGVVWSPAIGFGISVFVAFIGGFNSNKPLLGILVGIGCIVACYFTGWLAKILTVAIHENIHF